jgi:hypothetical protein
MGLYRIAKHRRDRLKHTGYRYENTLLRKNMDAVYLKNSKISTLVLAIDKVLTYISRCIEDIEDFYNFTKDKEIIDIIKVIEWRGVELYRAIVGQCPYGWQVSPDGLTCTKVSTLAPISTDLRVYVASSKHPAYSVFGSKLYDSYDVGGDGPYTRLPLNKYWSNTLADDGIFLYDWPAPTDGPMNDAGIWVDNDNDGIVDPLELGKEISFGFTLTIKEEKVYYFGIGGDNVIRLNVNGVLYINKNDILADNFRFWHIYPIVLKSGYNLINITGRGDGFINDSVAVKVYDAVTPFQLISATNDEEAGVIFTTKSLIGGSVQIIQCEAGYQPVDIGDGVYACQKIEQMESSHVSTIAYRKRERIINGKSDGYIEVNYNDLKYVPPIEEADISFAPPIQISWNFVTAEITDSELGTVGLPYAKSITNGGNISIPLTDMQQESTIVIRIPNGQPTFSSWYNTDLNNGPIPDFVFKIFTTGQYTYIRTRTQATFDTSQPLIINH